MVVTDEELVITRTNPPSVEKGSYSKVFAYVDAKGVKYVVKTIELEDTKGNHGKSLMNEKAFMITAASSSIRNYIPRLFEIDYRASGVSPLCSARSYVTHMLGVPLDIIKVESIDSLRQIAVQGTELLRSLHETGFVHGDVHAGNFLISGRISSPTLRMIDFGYTSAYLDMFGDHIPGNFFSNTWKFHQMSSPRSGTKNLNYVLLTPWQLESGIYALEAYTQSVRDDMFRFAEMLFLIGSLEYSSAFRELMNKIVKDRTRGGAVLATWKAFKNAGVGRGGQLDDLPTVF